ncbi:MAG: YqgE/AlgH family protein [Verrucomicrobiota bacterium]
MAGEPFQSLKGQLLLDSGQLTGSFFHRTVVLICQHDAEGAFGLVLNRPTENKVGDALVADIPDKLKEQILYLGGPVQPTALSYLHSDAFLPEGSVMPNLDLGHSVETLVELGQSFAATQQIRLFAGYSGWSPGQLEDEIARKAWVIHPASLELVFQGESKELWRRVLRAKEDWRYRLLADIPDDLSWN